MDKVLDTIKNGWHPEKDGGSGSFKNDVKGWIPGTGKTSDNENAENHVSQPLSSLKDPKSFGLPPKKLGHATSPERNPQSASTLSATTQDHVSPEQEVAEVPPSPYKIDTTGLATSNLPKPPIRRPDRGPPSNHGQSHISSKPKPKLPPRLPPRQDAAVPSSPPPSYSTAIRTDSAQNPHLNQDALNRLTNAGVSVPGVGIGTTVASKSTLTEHSLSDQVSSSGTSELQSRFPKLSSQPTSSSPSTSSNSTSTQRQNILKTASSLHRDPSSVTLNDAKSTAVAANNLQQGHGEQLAGGWQGIRSLDRKYGASNKIGGATAAQERSAPSAPASPASPRKKAAPPPPPRRAGLSEHGKNDPPPVPLETKPK